MTSVTFGETCCFHIDPTIQTETTTNQILFIKYNYNKPNTVYKIYKHIYIYIQTNVSESWITVCITGILLKVTHLLSCFFRTLFQLFLSFLGLFDLKQMRTKGCWHEASPDEFGLCCWTESALLAVVLQQFLRHTILIQEWLMLWPEAGTTRSSSSIFCRLAFSSSFSDSSASWRFLHVSWRINATGRNYIDDEHTMDLARSVRKKKTGAIPNSLKASACWPLKVLMP